METVSLEHVAVVSGARHVQRSQTATSRAMFGNLVGTSVPEATARYQEPATVRVLVDMLETAQDTGEPQVMLLPAANGLGRLDAWRAEGLLLTTWTWITEPLRFDHAARLRLAAEHLDRLAWALRTGRQLPHYPAGLRRGR
jgi:hypothetical protein